MKKLFVLGGVVIAFSAVTAFANGNNNSYGQAISGKQNVEDTVPKKDTTKKKKDSITFQIVERK